ncbi:MAG: HAD family hydrolase [Anaerohalosphaeraceae bacterium]|nr:HAD family hydrolase [Anaerohalosphaeraceae bacterium]
MSIHNKIPNGLIRAVIFDLDGTITEPFLDFDEIRLQIGLPPDSGPLLEAMESMSQAQRQKAEDVIYEHEKLAIAHSSLNFGAAETLDTIRNAGISVGVLTRNTHSNASAVAQKHSLSFDIIFDRNAGPQKPDPFGVNYLCKHFGIHPSEAIVVGDYLFDLQSARAAGAIAVLILTGKNEQFTKYADYTIDKLPDVLGIIEQRNKVK